MNLRKLLSVLAVLTIVTPATSLVVACGSDSTRINKTDLNDLIEEPNLGAIKMHNTIPNKIEILTGIQSKNPKTEHLTINDFALQLNEQNPGTQAIISGIGQYNGTVILKYSKTAPIALQSAITTTSLDAIYTGLNAKPDKTTLLQLIKAKNNNDAAQALQLDDFEIVEPAIGATELVIKGQNNYTGEVTLNSLTNFKNLGTVVINSYKGYDFTNMTISKKDDTLFFTNKAGSAVFKYNGTATSEITGIDQDCAITALVSDTKGNIYAGGYHNPQFPVTEQAGKIYKLAAGAKNFVSTAENLEKIRTLAIDNNNVIYAGGDNGKLYQSTDQATFTATNPFATNNATDGIWMLAFNSKNELFIGTIDQFYFKMVAGVTTKFNKLAGKINKFMFDKSDRLLIATGKGLEYGVANSDASSYNITPVHIINNSDEKLKGPINALTMNKAGIVYCGGANGTIYQLDSKMEAIPLVGINFNDVVVTTSGLVFDRNDNLFSITWVGNNLTIFKSEKF